MPERVEASATPYFRELVELVDKRLYEHVSIPYSLNYHVSSHHRTRPVNIVCVVGSDDNTYKGAGWGEIWFAEQTRKSLLRPV